MRWIAFLAAVTVIGGMGLAWGGEDADGDLIRAAKVANPAEIREALKGGADANAKGPDGMPPLMVLVANSDGHNSDEANVIRCVELLAAAGADLEFRDKEGRTALIRGLGGEWNAFAASALLKAGADIRARDGMGRDALMLALRSWRGRELVPRIVEAMPDLTATDADGNDALIMALRLAKSDIAELILDSGAKPEVVNMRGENPLHFAARGGSPELVGRLLDAGLSARALDLKGNHAGHYLSESRSERIELEEIMGSLKRAGLDPNVANGQGELPIHVAAVNGLRNAVLVLLANGADPNAELPDGKTPLSMAMENPEIHEAVAVALVEGGADPNTALDEKERVLHRAAEKVRADLVEALVRKGADLSVRRGDGATPLQLAVATFHGQRVSPETYSRLVEPLLKEGALADLPDESGVTPLMWVAAANRADFVKRMVQLGAKVDARAEDGRTAAMWAAVCGADDALAALKESGANLEIRDGGGRTAADWGKLGMGSETNEAAFVESKEVKRGAKSPVDAAALGDLDYLKRWIAKDGGQINAVKASGMGSLHLGAMRGNSEVVKLLLEAGADPNLKTDAGDNAIHWAVVNGHGEVLKQLLAGGAWPSEIGSGLGGSALELAISYRRDGMVAQLIEAGAEIKKGGGRLLIVAMRSGSIKHLRTLLEKGADPMEVVGTRGGAVTDPFAPAGVIDPFTNERRGTRGITAVSESGRNGNPAFLKALMEKVPPAENDDEKRRVREALDEAYFAACSENRGRMVRYLVEEMGANPDASFDGYAGVIKEKVEASEEMQIYTPLSISVKKGSPETVRFLLERGAQFRGTAGSKESPFIYAVSHSRPDLVEIMLDFDPPLGADGNGGKLPLVVAVYHEVGVGMAKKLLDAGAEVDAKTPIQKEGPEFPRHYTQRGGVSAFLLSCYYGDREMAEFLLENGADLKQVDGLDQNALYAAVLGGQKQIVEWLIQSGIDPNDRVGRDGKSALELAVEKGSKEMEALLLKYGARK